MGIDASLFATTTATLMDKDGHDTDYSLHALGATIGGGFAYH
jgi:hypothetical protein